MAREGVGGDQPQMTILAAMTDDPFRLFDLPWRFDLDEALLHRRFIDKSAANHPDRFTDPLDQADAAERSAAINGAYQTLTDPEKRANCLLALMGGPSGADDKSLPTDLLMQMMETRQRMEEAIAEQNADTLRELADWARDQRAAHLGEIAGQFDKTSRNDGATRNEALTAVRLQLNALRYIERMLEQMPDTNV
jgi:molecular chaperone HscB